MRCQGQLRRAFQPAPSDGSQHQRAGGRARVQQHGRLQHVQKRGARVDQVPLQENHSHQTHHRGSPLALHVLPVRRVRVPRSRREAGGGQADIQDRQGVPRAHGGHRGGGRGQGAVPRHARRPRRVPLLPAAQEQTPQGGAEARRHRQRGRRIRGGRLRADLRGLRAGVGRQGPVQEPHGDARQAAVFLPALREGVPERGAVEGTRAARARGRRSVLKRTPAADCGTLVELRVS